MGSLRESMLGCVHIRNNSGTRRRQMRDALTRKGMLTGISAFLFNNSTELLDLLIKVGASLVILLNGTGISLKRIKVLFIAHGKVRGAPRFENQRKRFLEKPTENNARSCRRRCQNPRLLECAAESASRRRM